jgi:cell wall-associated NlpC family hydrolase
VSPVVVSLLLDVGGREVVRVVGIVCTLLLCLLLLAIVTPIALVVGVSAGAPAVAPIVETSAPAGAASTRQMDAIPAASSDAVTVAQRYLGVPYVFGGTDPRTGLDCSGLVQLVFRQLGIALPRTAQMQFNAVQPVARDALLPGDLVFFQRTYADPHDWITHVGIYVGGGMQINAPTEGQVVSIQPVFSGFWGAHFAGGGRPRT